MTEWGDNKKNIIRDLGKILLKTDALQFGNFSLSSGKLSPYYIDLRILPSFPEAMKKALEAYLGLLKNIVGLGNVDVICGIPTSGLIYSALIAREVSKPLIYSRKDPKEYGRLRKIEGTLAPGSKVTVVDDLATTGDSIIEVIEAIRAEGGEVTDAIILIDRLEGAHQALKNKGVRLVSLTNIIELTDYLYEMKLLELEQITAIRNQVNSKLK
jgi:orotate phosphoribosyltransferase|tara:strand:+ start:577 stop:1215 length:639 start_codon:yes stop_codon:yes gene_type:complete